jgi:PAS domain S-box-containing protein
VKVLSLQRKLHLGFFLAAGLICLVGIKAFIDLAKFIDSAQQVGELKHLHEELQAAQALLDSGNAHVRRYMLKGEVADQIAAEADWTQLTTRFVEIAQLVAIDPEERRMANNLGALLAQLRARYAQVEAIRAKLGSQAALTAIYEVDGQDPSAALRKALFDVARRDRYLSQNLLGQVVQRALSLAQVAGLASGLFLVLVSGVTLTVRRRIAQRLAEDRRMAVEFSTTRILTDANPDASIVSSRHGPDSSSPAASPVIARILEAAGEALGWQVGVFWVADYTSGCLRCGDYWQSPTFRVSEFERLTQERTYPLGTGLPGAVWERGQPIWIANLAKESDPNFVDPAAVGLGSAFALPVILSGASIGVLEFFSSNVEPEDPELLRTMLIVGSHIGQLSERRVAAQALQESEARLKAILRTVPDGVVTIDERGTIESFNPAAEQLFGYSAAEVMGRNVTVLMPEPYRSEHDGYVQHFLRTRQPRLIGIGREVVGRRKDGSTFPLDLAVSELRFGDNRLRFTGTLRDITARRQAESLLRETFALQQAILDSANHAIISTDPSGVIVTFNLAAKEWLGYSVNEVVGRTTPAIFHDSDEVALYARELSVQLGQPVTTGFEALVARASRGEPDEGEWAYVRKDGSRFPVHLSVTALRDPDSNITGFLTIASDITERNRARRELLMAKEAAERANQSKSEFLANMSHELRTPLNSVIGFANILLKNKAKNLRDQDVTYLARILDNGKHLLGLINSILDLSKIEAGRMEPQIGPVSLDAAVKEVVAQFESQLVDREVKLVAELPAEVMPIQSDGVHIRQVLINLVGNALKFTEKGLVTVKLEVDPSTKKPMILSVADTGIGIPLDRQHAVFDAFQQADNTTARRYGGTGLGLTITRALLEQLGFAITLESEEGKGTTFKILFGVQPPGSKAAQQQPDETERFAFGQLSRLTEKLVLIIDDEADTRALLAQLVEEMGCRVIKAPSGEWGLERARMQHPDLIILDLLMPGLNGWDVLQQLGADTQLSGIPIIIASIAAAENRGTIPGVVACLNKPVVPEELRGAIHRALDTKRGRVLVVDDEEDVRDLFSIYLQGQGAEVRCAENGQEALDVLRSFTPDLILLDLLMPVMGGMAFLDALRKDPVHKNTPAIVITGKLLEAEEAKELEEKATAIMKKGEELEQYLKQVMTQLPDRRKRNRPEKTVVKVQSKLAELIPGFLKNRQKDIEQLKQAVEWKDFSTIQRIGHQLRGAGGGYGFMGISDIGAQMETAGKAQDLEGTKQALDALVRYLNSLEVVYT